MTRAQRYQILAYATLAVVPQRKRDAAPHKIRTGSGSDRRFRSIRTSIHIPRIPVNIAHCKCLSQVEAGRYRSRFRIRRPTLPDSCLRNFGGRASAKARCSAAQNQNRESSDRRFRSIRTSIHIPRIPVNIAHCKCLSQVEAGRYRSRFRIRRPTLPRDAEITAEKTPRIKILACL